MAASKHDGEASAKHRLRRHSTQRDPAMVVLETFQSPNFSGDSWLY